MDIKFQPLGDRVLIEDNNSGEKTSEGGLILTESTRKGAVVMGKVVAVGTGIFSQSGQTIPMTVKIGDTVMYKKDMGAEEVKIQGLPYLLFNEHQLMGIVSE